MMLSKLIAKLQEIKAHCGDVEVIAAEDIGEDDIWDALDDVDNLKSVNDAFCVPCGEGAVMLAFEKYDPEA